MSSLRLLQKFFADEVKGESQIKILVWVSTLLLFSFLLFLPNGARGRSEGESPSTSAEVTPTASDPHDLLNRPGPLWLVGVDWQGANLNDAHLTGANLSQGKLQGALLNNADLSNANLMMAGLQASQLVQAHLDGADLGLANLARARLTMATLVAAKMEAATLVESNLTGANLDKARLSHGDLRRAVLRNAILTGADLSVADLRGADLQGADLTGANLTNANLEGANLQDANLTDITYDQQTLWPAGFDPAHVETAASTPHERQPLHFQVNLVPGVAQHFNQMAQMQDSAHVDAINDMAMLEDIHAGQRMAVFKSAALAEQLAPRSAGYFDLLGYNLEHGPINPLDEQRDPIGSVQRIRAVADRLGVPLAVGADHDFVLSDGVRMAPYADQFILQVQRVQDQPQLVEAYVISMATALRQANPAIEVLVQVRTDGDMDALVKMLKNLEPHIDGVAILTSRETTDFAMTLWQRLRQDSGQQPTSADSVATVSSPYSWIAPLFVGILFEVAVVAFIIALLWLLPRAFAGNGSGTKPSSQEPNV